MIQNRFQNQVTARLLLLACSVLLYVLLLYIRSLQANLEFGDIVFLDPITSVFISHSVSLNADQLRWLSYVVFLGISALYGLMLYYLSKQRLLLPHSFFGWVILPYLVLGAVILLLYPHISRPTDTADYAVHARVQWQFHQNPYVVAGGEYADQSPLPRFMEAKTRPSVYGPAWQIMTLPSLIAQDNILSSILIFKAMFFLMGLGCLVLAFFYSPSQNSAIHAERIFAAAAVAWNPLLLLIAIGQGHNDIAMALFIALALAALSFRRPLMGYASLILSALVKFISLPLLLPVTVLVYRDAAFGTVSQRRKLIILGLLVSVVFGSLLVLPYGPLAISATISSRYAGLVGTDGVSKIALLASLLNRLLLALGLSLAPDLIARSAALLLPSLWLGVVLVRSNSVRSLNHLVKVLIESFLVYLTMVALPVHAQYAITPVVLLGFLYAGRWHFFATICVSLALVWDALFLVYIPDTYPLWEAILHQLSHSIALFIFVLFVCLLVFQSARRWITA